MSLYGTTLFAQALSPVFSECDSNFLTRINSLSMSAAGGAPGQGVPAGDPGRGEGPQPQAE